MSRVKWKGPYINKISDLKNNLSKRIKILPRNFEITTQTVGSTFNVHSGKNL